MQNAQLISAGIAVLVALSCYYLVEPWIRALNTGAGEEIEVSIATKSLARPTTK